MCIRLHFGKFCLSKRFSQLKLPYGYVSWDVIFYFLKSLRSLEEFKKNLHAQIPPKSPCRIFQILAKFQIPLKFKNQFSIESSMGIRPDRPSSTHPCQPTPPLRQLLLTLPIQPECLWRILQNRLSSLIGAFHRLAVSLSPLANTWAPSVNIFPFPHAARAWPRCCLSAPLLATMHYPAST
jgi:hypothetical protein